MNVDVYEEHVRFVNTPWTGIFMAYAGQMWCVFDCAIGMLWRGGHCKRCVAEIWSTAYPLAKD
jgi:hypothetical protein